MATRERIGEPAPMSTAPQEIRYPYHVELRMPATGLRERYGETLRSAGVIAGYGWDAWRRRGGKLVVALTRHEQAQNFRQWRPGLDRPVGVTVGPRAVQFLPEWLLRFTRCHAPGAVRPWNARGL
jgi:hypothetical protein